LYYCQTYILISDLEGLNVLSGEAGILGQKFAVRWYPARRPLSLGAGHGGHVGHQTGLEVIKTANKSDLVKTLRVCNCGHESGGEGDFGIHHVKGYKGR